MGQYIAGLAGDPCAYLNNAGNSVDSVDQNSSPGECKQTGGQWLPPQPPGTMYGVDANGNAYPIPPQRGGPSFCAGESIGFAYVSLYTIETPPFSATTGLISLGFAVADAWGVCDWVGAKVNAMWSQMKGN